MPLPAISPLFQREVADVHRELYAENGDLYGEDLAWKIEKCLAVAEAEVAGAITAREDYRQLVEELLDEIDLLVTPTIPTVAPPVGIEPTMRLHDPLAIGVGSTPPSTNIDANWTAKSASVMTVNVAAARFRVIARSFRCDYRNIIAGSNIFAPSTSS